MLLAVVLLPACAVRAEGVDAEFEASAAGLSVKVPAGGGCPERSYRPEVAREAEMVVVQLRRVAQDACKGWFPGEFRWISFSWQSIGLEQRPARLKVLVEP